MLHTIHIMAIVNKPYKEQQICQRGNQGSMIWNNKILGSDTIPNPLYLGLKQASLFFQKLCIIP